MTQKMLHVRVRFEELSRRLDPERVRSKVRAVLQDITQKIVADAVGNVPVDTGAARASLRSRVDLGPGPLDLTGRVYATAQHFLFLELGAKWTSKWPPDAPIRNWVLHKGLLTRALESEAVKTGQRGRIGRRAFGRFGRVRTTATFEARAQKDSERRTDIVQRTTDKILDGIVFLIRRALKHRGLAPRFMVRGAWHQNRPYIEEQFRVLGHQLFTEA